MVAVPSFMTARNMLSPLINGVAVRFDQVPESIRRFCAPAFFYNENSNIEMSRSGSALQFRYRGRNIAIYCRHQLGSGDNKFRPDRFIVTAVDPTGKKLGITPNKVSTPRVSNPEHANLEDVVLLEYDSVRDDRDLRKYFLSLNIGNNLENIDKRSIYAIFAIGYPYSEGSQEYEYDENSDTYDISMQLRWVKLYLSAAPAGLMDTENRILLVPNEKADQKLIEPEGMSGAPVFFIWQDQARNAHLGFAGVITDARAERYAIYSGAQIRRLVDDYIDKNRV